MNIRSAGTALLAAVAVLFARELVAQPVTSLSAERSRLAGITGDSLHRAHPDPLLSELGADGLPMLRRLDWSRIPLTFVRPDVRVVWNSDLPFSLNDGPLWAGRGLNVSVGAGLAWRQPYRRVILRATIAPLLHYSENLPFQIFPNRTPGRSAFANPFHGAASGASIDLPHRFGNRHVLGVDAGRSELAVEWPFVTAGATARNERWGPGIRNAIVMSDHAPGVPRLFVETSRPLQTRAGRISAKLIAGTLTRSPFFDPQASEHRTLSGLLVELIPAFDSTLTFGLSRVVYAPVNGGNSPLGAVFSHFHDAFTRWENLDGAGVQSTDQIAALFARWIFPTAGFEIYGEWARMDLPRSATELLTAAHHTGGWTFGFSWAQPRSSGRYLRLQSELTYLEQSRVFDDRPSPDFYSGQASPHGYTHRGQVIGAAIGPGSSSQTIAVDWIVPRWQAGIVLGRIRWDNDAMYRDRTPTFWDHDVSLLAGARAGWRTALSDFTAELTVAKRYNYLFQNGIARPEGRTVDVNNLTFSLAATPR